MSAQYPSTFQISRHIHDDLVITVTEQGAGDTKTHYSSTPVEPGTIWVSGMGEYHSGKSYYEQSWQYRAMYLNQNALRSISNIFDEAANQNMIIPPGVYFNLRLARLLVQLHKTLEANASCIERQTLWYSTMGLLLERYGQNKPTTTPIGPENVKMNIARDYMMAHYQDNITIDDLAMKAGLSRFHFIRVFQRKFGLPPHAYINQIRLSSAKHLLDKGNSPAAVALDVGFYDQSHLNRLFKKSFGITPGVYIQTRN